MNLPLPTFLLELVFEINTDTHLLLSEKTLDYHKYPYGDNLRSRYV